MSALLDDRESGLEPYLSPHALPLSTVRLPFGDFAIQSCDSRNIGYERKRLSDLIASMQDRRLSGHQIKGMYSMYDRVELVIEGVWRCGQSGEIEVPMGRGQGWTTLYGTRMGRTAGITYRQVDSYLYSLSECGGVYVWRTQGPVETAALYASRYHWWQKDYRLHRSHDQLFANWPAAQRRGAITLHQGQPNPVTIVSAQCPGIDAKAWDIGKQFTSVFDMVTASESDWRGIWWTDRKGNTKRFGKETARQIVDWLHGRIGHEGDIK